MRRSHTFSIPIAASYDAVYRYLAEPRNFPQWAAIEGRSFAALGNGDWAGETPFGFRHFRFTPVNAFGVLDHAIFEPGQPMLFMPMRVVPNGTGTELHLLPARWQQRRTVRFEHRVDHDRPSGAQEPAGGHGQRARLGTGLA